MSVRLLSNLRAVRRCRRHDGCYFECSRDRVDGARLPWDPAGAYGGWGGHEYHGTAAGTDRTPVVFVHGNQRDACDWEEYGLYFRQRSYRGDELWAITFAEASPSHAEMCDQLEAFVGRVREYTGAERVHVVAHSLGVTGVRYWLARRDRYDWLDAFVGLAGANHGMVLSSMCADVGLTHDTYRSSEFLRADYQSIPDHPLAALNENETPGDVDYYTIRGTGDPLFWNCERSPELDGAVNEVLETDHDGVRTDPRAKALVFEWLSGEHPYNLQIQVDV
ncbi:MAG: esterase/lipase family protein [Haloarculaceae archaeon]